VKEDGIVVECLRLAGFAKMQSGCDHEVPYNTEGDGGAESEGEDEVFDEAVHDEK
jgi:hypothetical protein